MYQFGRGDANAGQRPVCGRGLYPYKEQRQVCRILYKRDASQLTKPLYRAILAVLSV